MLLFSTYYLFYSILLVFVFYTTLDLIFYGEIPSATLTAPFTPLLTRSLGVGSGIGYLMGY
jgi:hypothetical protein